MTALRLVTTILSLALALVRWLESRRRLRMAERIVIARHLEDIARQARVAKEIDGRVMIMTDDDVTRELEREGWLHD